MQRVGGREPVRGDLGALYDAIEQPRKIRGELPILKAGEVRPYMEGVRGRMLEVLEEVDLDSEDPLIRDGFLYEMLLAHEHQHNETMLQLIQMVESYEPIAVDQSMAACEPVAEGPEMVPVEGGRREVGAGPEGFAYDNERPLHEVELAAFEIDRTPVTNGAYAEFMAATGAEPPMYWQPDGDWWKRTAMGREQPVDPGHPVIHVSWNDADAFAVWAGKRLPSEHEWEVAARGASVERANLDQLGFGTAPAGAYADGCGDCGAVQMLGDVWEWTSSDFTSYPGFEAFPYPEYSEVFFGDTFKVLRGGAWATRPDVIRHSFRNWDLPERRQIFSGFRCARDA